MARLLVKQQASVKILMLQDFKLNAHQQLLLGMETFSNAKIVQLQPLTGIILSTNARHVQVPLFGMLSQLNVSQSTIVQAVKPSTQQQNNANISIATLINPFLTFNQINVKLAQPAQPTHHKQTSVNQPTIETVFQVCVDLKLLTGIHSSWLVKLVHPTKNITLSL